MQKKLTALLIVVSLLFPLALIGGAQPASSVERQGYENTIRAARETLWKAITSGQGSGAAIAVMDKGKLVYSEGLGVKNRESNLPVGRHTRFNIGSTSKMFAAVAVLLLVDEGKVRLDDSVANYIPDFRMKDERYKEITVRMLFNHSSGLPGSSFYFSYKPGHDMHTLLLDTLAEEHLKHRPGAMSGIYCNDAFTLAEIIVERVSGRRFLAFLEERVFRPLGMHDTGASVGEMKGRDIADYYNAKSGKKYPPEVATVLGAGGLSSTAEDLCRFGNSFCKGGRSLLSEASLKEIRTTQPSLFSDKLRGRQLMSEFGWEYTHLSPYDEKGIQVMGKGGNTLCYSSNLQIAPDEGIVIGLCISGGVGGETLTRPVLDALMAEKKRIAQQEKHASKPPEPQEIPAEMLRYEGFYTEGSAVVKVTIDRKEKKIALYPCSAPGSPGGPKKEPIQSFIYSEGMLYNGAGAQAYFTTIEGRSYLAGHGYPIDHPVWSADMLVYQKLDELKSPQALEVDVEGRLWLLRNMPPDVLAGSVALIKSSSLEGLPGYIDFGGIKKVESPTYAAIAATCFRDQTELQLMEKNGERWAKMGISLLSGADGAKNAASGDNALVIGRDGFNEWLKLDKGAVLSFEKPKDGRIIVLTEEKTIYDSLVDTGEIYAPQGSFVFCAGAPGQVFRISAR